MTKAELIERITEIEWEDFEVKSAASEIPKSSWETVSAFANTNGGWLILGIKQIGSNYEMIGVKNAEKIEQDFLNTLRGEKFNAKIFTRQSFLNINNKKILCFYIEPSADKPIYFNNLANTFIRRGSADQRASKEEIDSMFRDQAFGTKTSQMAPGTLKSHLNNHSMDRYRDYMSRFNPSVSYNRYTLEEFLDKLRITENNSLTYGGLLMFGKREIIEKHFPDFRIDLLEVPGTSYTDAKLRYTYRLEEQENLWEYYFSCFDRLKQKVDVRFKLTAEGFGQELSPGLEAIREALVNMLMHTDYFSPAHPRIRIFNDHIEFYNPGGLPKSVEELKAKDLSIPRNPIITKLFRMVRLAENAGFGLDKIEQNWLQYNQTTPEIIREFDSTLVIMSVRNVRNIDKVIYKKVKEPNKWGDKWGERWEELWPEIENWWKKEIDSNLNNSEIKILDMMAVIPEITMVQLSNKIGIVETAIGKNISKLKEKKIIQRVGPARGGYWEIIK